jgi:FixJ family two-component response regulator
MSQDSQLTAFPTRAGALISLVDDDESFRTSTSRLLRVMGFIVQSFSSAENFLSSPDLHETACLILDVQMPGTGGPELQTRTIDMGLEIPVIFVTANAEERNRILETERRAVDVLLKPFSEEALLRAVKTALAL